MSTVRALLLSPDGTAEIIDIEPTETALQAVVGGYLEAVPMPGGAHGWCDEDANLKDPVPAVNLPATRLAAVVGFPVHLRGPVLVLGGEPDEADVPEATLAVAREHGLLP